MAIQKQWQSPVNLDSSDLDIEEVGAYGLEIPTSLPKFLVY